MVPSTPPTAPPQPPARPVLPAIIEGSSVTETVEVRWWHDRPFPSGLWDLCRAASGSDGELEHRVDTYLRHCGRDLAVKLRDGDLLEIKQRCGAVVASELVTGVAGRVAQWRKWSFACTGGPDSVGDTDASAQDTSPDGDHAADHWVPVAKSRCLVGAGAASVEIAEIRSLRRLHWTLALEVPAGGGVGELRDAADALGLARFPRWFVLDTSASYADFLEPPPPSGLVSRSTG